MADARFREQMEQERRDHELALRLAQETNGQLEDVSPPMRRYVLFVFFHTEHGGLLLFVHWKTEITNINFMNYYFRSESNRTLDGAEKCKYDLSKWKYSELRDTINTSCDIDLLEVISRFILC